MPTKLILTHATSSSIHLSWTPALYPPLKYLIVWQPSRGGAPKEVRGGPLVQPLLRPSSGVGAADRTQPAWFRWVLLSCV